MFSAGSFDVFRSLCQVFHLLLRGSELLSQQLAQLKDALQATRAAQSICVTCDVAKRTLGEGYEAL